MPWFSHTAKDLITSEDLARYGRFELLGAELSGIDRSGAWALLEPLRDWLYSNLEDMSRGTTEIRRHAKVGEWEAVGAWKCAVNMVPDKDLEANMADAAMIALARMRITNLAIHLGPAYIRRFEELTGERPPNDGFFGPPVFDSHFGPTRQYYVDQAVAAAAARTPRRIPSTSGVQPGQLVDAARCLWDFGMLVLRGPALVGQDVRFEPSTVHPAVEAATGVDHALFCEQLHDVLVEQAREGFNGWAFMGAARFLEDYLEPELTGSPVHAKLVDAGLEQLASQAILGTGAFVEVLSTFERGRL